MISNIRKQYEETMRGCKAAYSEGQMKKDYFHELMEKAWKKRAKVLAEEAVLQRKRSLIANELAMESWGERFVVFPDAYDALFTNLFQPLERSAQWEKRNRHKQETWKDGLIEYYDLASLHGPDFLWCPILKRYAESEDCVAAQFVPHSLGYKNVGYLFGDADEGYSMVWSLRNGMIMTKQLEKAFDEGTFIIVPMDTASDDKPQRYKLVLMDEKRRNQTVKTLGGPVTTAIRWRDLDNTELEFQNDKRPARRYLYYHYITTILRHARYEKHGWAERRLTVPHGTIWATPGPYLRKSMLKVLAASIGDCEPSRALEAGGTFEGQDDKSEEEERLIAGEALVIRDRPELHQPFDVDEEEKWGGILED